MADRRSAQLTVRLSDRDVRAILSELKDMPHNMAKAELTAVKRTMRTAGARVAKQIRGVANLKSSEIKDRIVQTRKPSSSAPSGVLTIKGTRIALWKFSRSMADLAGFTSQKGVARTKRRPKTGAGWKIYKGEKTARQKGFFVDRETKSSQIQIFRRRSDSRGGDKARPGIDYRTAYGLSLAEIMRRKNLKPPIVAEILEVLEKNLRSQVDRFLKRRKSDRG